MFTYKYNYIWCVIIMLIKRIWCLCDYLPFLKLSLKFNYPKKEKKIKLAVVLSLSFHPLLIIIHKVNSIKAFE